MRKFIYDVWGDTVNTASRLESHGVTGRVQVSDTVFERLQNRFSFESRGTIELKGRGAMNAYFLTGPDPDCHSRSASDSAGSGKGTGSFPARENAAAETAAPQ
jgi:class 3 adenylate cyclase